MTEQYKDAYQNKYREEIAQVHAPLNLIEKTKAAVREEEKRLAMAGAAPAKQEGMPVSNFEDANRQKSMRVFSVRKWAYPLTAAAAILILASVSLTMRGLKSVHMSDTAMPAAMDEAAESGAVYEESVESADAGYAEAAAEEPADYEVAEASEAPVMEAESVEDMLTDETAGTAGADSVSEAENRNDMTSAGAGQTNGLSRDKDIAETAPTEKKMEAAGKQQGEGGRQDDFTIEKVATRPARFSGSDVEIHRYEGKTFRVLEKDSAGNNAEKTWETYVELSTGEGYVICGEAESVDDFLAAAHQKLEEEIINE